MEPHQLEGDRLWFGKTFYDSESVSGVGGFGFFDASTKSFHMYAPQEMAAWSVSAILVEPDIVWLSLFRRGEYGNDAGGLLRWDRNTEAARLIPSRFIFSTIARYGDALYLGGNDGINVLRGNEMTSYFVDGTSDGRYRVAKRSAVL